MESSQAQVINISDSENVDEKYLKICYPNSSEFIEAPLAEDGKLLFDDIQSLESNIISLNLTKSGEFKRLYKPKNGCFKEPNEKWNSFKVVAVLKDSTNDSKCIISMNGNTIATDKLQLPDVTKSVAKVEKTKLETSISTAKDDEHGEEEENPALSKQGRKPAPKASAEDVEAPNEDEPEEQASSKKAGRHGRKPKAKKDEEKAESPNENEGHEEKPAPSKRGRKPALKAPAEDVEMDVFPLDDPLRHRRIVRFQVEEDVVAEKPVPKKDGRGRKPASKAVAKEDKPTSSTKAAAGKQNAAEMNAKENAEKEAPPAPKKGRPAKAKK